MWEVFKEFTWPKKCWRTAMFEQSNGPRVFGTYLGSDFSRSLVGGLKMRSDGLPPEAIASTILIVNTRRMARRVEELFTLPTAGFRPKILLVTELAKLAAPEIFPVPSNALDQQIELSNLVAAYLDKRPDLAPREFALDLAESLGALRREMLSEGVDPSAIKNLNVETASAHWQDNLSFLQIVFDYWEATPDHPVADAVHRSIVEHLAAQWQIAPPTHPIIVAGSTGSQGTTRTLMRAIARLPQGALVLPGFDFEQPADVWQSLCDDETGEDHPQFRFNTLARELGLDVGDIRPWIGDASTREPRRKLISLSMTPAPVTDKWLVDGPNLPSLTESTSRMSLIQADTPRDEALAIAICVREALEHQKTVSVITPDRVLTRQLSAALRQFNINADDSAGRPLQLTPPGLFLRQVLSFFATATTAEKLLGLLKNPITNTASGDRGLHLLRTRELELYLRKNSVPKIYPDLLSTWCDIQKNDTETAQWIDWIANNLLGLEDVKRHTLTDFVRLFRKVAETVSAGPNPQADTLGELWLKEAGEEALKAMQKLEAVAEIGVSFSVHEIIQIATQVIAEGDVRTSLQVRSDVKIWGTLEARVETTDVTILAGLNDGVWPKMPPLDPWLNRRMRKEAGLLLPERQIGLSAHDYQQAVCSETVVLSRSFRNEDGPTVPSRWLNRLSNLLMGLGEEGRNSYESMVARGQYWVDLANRSEKSFAPQGPTKRPAPIPPKHARPTRLSVTEVERLIQDPYAIYARHCLRLRPLDALRPEPDARMRGTVIHEILDTYIGGKPDLSDLNLARDQLEKVTKEVLEELVPWPATRLSWLARMTSVADWLIETESRMASVGSPIAQETMGSAQIGPDGFLLTAKADRIDTLRDGGLSIVDYKSGAVPSKADLNHYNIQLALESVIAELGGFSEATPQSVRSLEYIGLGSGGKTRNVQIAVEEVAERLGSFLNHHLNGDLGFVSRARMKAGGWAGDYDHLARFGEWDETVPPVDEAL
jgi:ATP-dependent helicase/nuclease subunit B